MPLITFFYNVVITILIIISMDSIDKFVRKNLKYEVNKGKLLKLKDRFLKFIPNNFGIIKSIRLYLRTKRDMKECINKKIKTKNEKVQSARSQTLKPKFNVDQSQAKCFFYKK